MSKKKFVPMSQRYKRLGAYGIEEVLSKVASTENGHKTRGNHELPDHIAAFGGRFINMTSTRYQLFKRDGCKCVTCGIEGNFFSLDVDFKNSHLSDPHFNLIAVNSIGQEVLMTKDHIKPKRFYGTNNLANMQVMCEKCNSAKGSKVK